MRQWHTHQQQDPVSQEALELEHVLAARRQPIAKPDGDADERTIEDGECRRGGKASHETRRLAEVRCQVTLRRPQRAVDDLRDEAGQRICRRVEHLDDRRPAAAQPLGDVDDRNEADQLQRRQQDDGGDQERQRNVIRLFAGGADRKAVRDRGCHDQQRKELR